MKRRADWRCQVCNSQHDLCAHHRTYEHRGRELEFLTDLICLCRRCHEVFHGKPSERDEAVEASQTELVATETQIPNGNTLVLTRELIDALRTNGAFTTATLKHLSVGSRPTSGWTFRLAGTTMPRDQYMAALRGRGVYAKKTKKLKALRAKSCSPTLRQPD